MSKKGSILIMVLFILFLSSFAWLLIVKYVKNIMEYSSEFYKYYKAYYIAYWWIELEITKIKNRWFGFEDNIPSNSATVKNNLKYCYKWWCSFQSSIKTNAKILSKEINSYAISSCDETVSYKLMNWQWIIIPLFKDVNGWEWALAPATISYTNIWLWDFASLKFKAYNSNLKQYTISVVDELSQDNKSYKTSITSNDYEKWLNSPEFNNFYNDSRKSFLIVANSENSFSSQKICLASNVVSLPSGYVTVESVWKFFDRVVSLQAVKLNKLPEYLIYNIIEH